MRYNKLFNVEFWVTQFMGYTEFAKTSGKYPRGYHEGLDGVPIDRRSWQLFTPNDTRCMWAGEGHPGGGGEYYGLNVILWDEIRGLFMRYCHLDSYEVKEGDILRANERFGVAGDSGGNWARHVHLNAIPMTTYGKKHFPNNGWHGRVDPVGVLHALKVHI